MRTCGLTDRAGNITVLNSDGVVVYTDAQADTRQITYVKLQRTGCLLPRRPQRQHRHRRAAGGRHASGGLHRPAEDGTVTLPAATLQALAAGDYILYVTYAPLGVAYNARYEASEAPAMTSVALSVQKAEGSVAILDDVSRDYNGQPVEAPAITSLGTGALTVEYRRRAASSPRRPPRLWAATPSGSRRRPTMITPPPAPSGTSASPPSVSPSTASPWSPPRPMTAPPTPPS